MGRWLVRWEQADLQGVRGQMDMQMGWVVGE